MNGDEGIRRVVAEDDRSGDGASHDACLVVVIGCNPEQSVSLNGMGKCLIVRMANYSRIENDHWSRREDDLNFLREWDLSWLHVDAKSLSRRRRRILNLKSA